VAVNPRRQAGRRCTVPGMDTVIALAGCALFVWFVVMLCVGSSRLAKKGVDAMDAAVQINQRMTGRPLPPPPPGSTPAS
jgi:hypothetical protein